MYFNTEVRHIVHYLRQVRLGQKLDVLPEPLIYHVYFALRSPPARRFRSTITEK